MKVCWKTLVLAFAMAVALWYGVSGSEKVESIVEVRVDYRGLPAGYIVRSGQINKIEVRLRAPVNIARGLTDRNLFFYMDISSVKKGENVMQIDPARLPFMRNVEVIDIAPSRINLDVDTSARKTVPVTGAIKGQLNQDLIAKLTFSPAEAMVSGPSEEVGAITALPVEVEVDPNMPPGKHETIRQLLLPENIEAKPAEVQQTLHISIKRKLVSLSRKVDVELPKEIGSFVRPERVNIQLAVPLSLVDGIQGSKEVKAFVQLDNDKLGTQNLPVLVSLPPGVELVKVEPKRIAVTLEQKKPRAQSARSGKK